MWTVWQLGFLIGPAFIFWEWCAGHWINAWEPHSYYSVGGPCHSLVRYHTTDKDRNHSHTNHIHSPGQLFRTLTLLLGTEDWLIELVQQINHYFWMVILDISQGRWDFTFSGSQYILHLKICIKNVFPRLVIIPRGVTLTFWECYMVLWQHWTDITM